MIAFHHSHPSLHPPRFHQEYAHFIRETVHLIRETAFRRKQENNESHSRVWLVRRWPARETCRTGAIAWGTGRDPPFLMNPRRIQRNPFGSADYNSFTIAQPRFEGERIRKGWKLIPISSVLLILQTVRQRARSGCN